MQAQTLGFAAVLAVAALAPTAVLAQSAVRAAERFDSRMNRQPLAAAPIVPPTNSVAPMEMMSLAQPRVGYLDRKATGQEEKEEPPKITVSLGLAVPIAFNTNPEHVSSGKDGDGHIDPGLQFGITRETKGGILTLGVAGDMDFNFDRPANDSTTLVGAVNYDFKTDRLGGAVPFLNYTAVDLYSGQFDDHAVTLHEFAAGANLQHKLPLSKNAPAGATPITLSVSGSLTRREASAVAANQNRVGGLVGISGKWGEQLGWSLSQGAAYKDYTGGANKSREDVTFTTNAAVSTTFGNLNFSFGVQLEHNVSNQAGSDYTFWNVGPTLSRAF